MDRWTIEQTSILSRTRARHGFGKTVLPLGNMRFSGHQIKNLLTITDYIDEITKRAELARIDRQVKYTLVSLFHIYLTLPFLFFLNDPTDQSIGPIGTHDGSHIEA